MIPLTIKQIKLLEEAKKYCDDNDKSTEFMLEYMKDVAKVSLDMVISFLTERTFR